jgi:hypothetical protein
MMVRRSIVEAVHLNPVSASSPMAGGTAPHKEDFCAANALDLRHFIHEHVCIPA